VGDGTRQESYGFELTGLLSLLFEPLDVGNVTEHHDRSPHLAIAITNRCNAIGNITLGPVAGDEHGPAQRRRRR